MAPHSDSLIHWPRPKFFSKLVPNVVFNNAPRPYPEPTCNRVQNNNADAHTFAPHQKDAKPAQPQHTFVARFEPGVAAAGDFPRRFGTGIEEACVKPVKGGVRWEGHRGRNDLVR